MARPPVPITIHHHCGDVLSCGGDATLVSGSLGLVLARHGAPNPGVPPTAVSSNIVAIPPSVAPTVVAACVDGLGVVIAATRQWVYHCTPASPGSSTGPYRRTLLPTVPALLGPGDSWAGVSCDAASDTVVAWTSHGVLYTLRRAQGESALVAVSFSNMLRVAHVSVGVSGHTVALCRGLSAVKTTVPSTRHGSDATATRVGGSAPLHIRCWGNPKLGQCGVDPTSLGSDGAMATIAIPGRKVPLPDGSGSPVHVAAGDGVAAALTDRGEVYAWGRHIGPRPSLVEVAPLFRALAPGDKTPVAVSLDAGGFHGAGFISVVVRSGAERSAAIITVGDSSQGGQAVPSLGSSDGCGSAAPPSSIQPLIIGATAASAVVTTLSGDDVHCGWRHVAVSSSVEIDGRIAAVSPPPCAALAGTINTAGTVLAFCDEATVAAVALTSAAWAARARCVVPHCTDTSRGVRLRMPPLVAARVVSSDSVLFAHFQKGNIVTVPVGPDVHKEDGPDTELSSAAVPASAAAAVVSGYPWRALCAAAVREVQPGVPLVTLSQSPPSQDTGLGGALPCEGVSRISSDFAIGPQGPPLSAAPAAPGGVRGLWKSIAASAGSFFGAKARPRTVPMFSSSGEISAVGYPGELVCRLQDPAMNGQTPAGPQSAGMNTHLVGGPQGTALQVVDAGQPRQRLVMFGSFIVADNTACVTYAVDADTTDRADMDFAEKLELRAVAAVTVGTPSAVDGAAVDAAAVRREQSDEYAAVVQLSSLARRRIDAARTAPRSGAFLIDSALSPQPTARVSLCTPPLVLVLRSGGPVRHGVLNWSPERRMTVGELAARGVVTPREVFLAVGLTLGRSFIDAPPIAPEAALEATAQVIASLGEPEDTEGMDARAVVPWSAVWSRRESRQDHAAIVDMAGLLSGTWSPAS